MKSSALAFLLPFLLSFLAAQVVQANYTQVSDAVPQLAGFLPNPILSVPLRFGGQNFTHCCLRAVSESLIIINGTLATTKQSFITNFALFENGDFPCGSTFNGSMVGAAPVDITYSWCRQNCDGWQLSTSKKLNEWVAPLVGFLIPAVVFCLAIPRQRKLYIGEWFFDVAIGEIYSSPRILYKAPLSAFLVTVDTIVWLMIVFTLAGPLLLSGIYEAYTDIRILSYLQEKTSQSRLPIDRRAQLLYAVLVGNLDLFYVPEHDDDGEDAWTHVDSLVDGLRRSTLTNQDLVERTKTRLRTMLAVQYSFGTTVGAPVVFFSGSFIYTLIDNFSNMGNNHTSHALAFGMWWMTIPHISIISGLLLAGNNPNTLEGVVGHKSCPDQEPHHNFLSLVYESRYMPSWLWFRGCSKRLWIDEILADWKERTASMTAADEEIDRHHFEIDRDQLKRKMKMSVGDWMTVGVYAWILVVVPSVLAFLTSFYTPKVGLACRSLTFLVYILAQLWLLVLWTWYLSHSHMDQRKLHTPSTNRRTKYVWYFCFALGVSAAVFTAIGGTMMQIMGVYQNCLCDIPISEWHDANAQFTISDNFARAIEAANTWWKGTGAIAAAFLGFICYLGWWYQRRLRFQFRELVANIDFHPYIPHCTTAAPTWPHTLTSTPPSRRPPPPPFSEHRASDSSTMLQQGQPEKVVDSSAVPANDSWRPSRVGTDVQGSPGSSLIHHFA